MQETSQLYKELFETKHETEIRLLVGNKETPLEEMNTVYGEDTLVSVFSSIKLFPESTLTVGSCVAGDISVKMLYPNKEIPKQGKIVPQVRLTDGVRHSEWISKGVFFIDERMISGEDGGIKTLDLIGFDAMLKAEQDYPSSNLNWPATDIKVVKEIAKFIGVEVDPQTVSIINKGYKIQLPTEYSCREVLGYIAAMYAGNFVMSDTGKLRLVLLYDLPAETNYLITNSGQAITFGGVRILV